MEPIEPAYGTATLLLLAAVAVALLLFLIMKVKLHAFISLVLVSVVTAMAVGFSLTDIPDVLMFGFADTIGSVALLVAFGVMLGRLLEVSGGAQVLADTLITRFGARRAPLALGVASLLFGFPIFFDAGLVVFLPIIITVARRFGGSVMLYAMPSVGAFAAMHAMTPPHPGPVAAAEALGGNIGVTMLVGIPVAVAAWAVGVLPVARHLGMRIHVDVPELLFGETRDTGGKTARKKAGKKTGKSAGKGAGRTARAVAEDDDPWRGRGAPAFSTVLGLLLLPLVLISFDTVLDTLTTAGAIEEGADWAEFLGLLGNTSVALMLSVLAAILVIGLPRASSMSEVTRTLDSALGPICSIILITGAGGMFGGVLELSGIGSALSDSLGDLGISLIVQAFLIATLLRVAQGSATVALTTTAGLIAAPVAAADLGDVQIALLVVAVAAGATVLSHVNDSGFWLVSRFFGMDERTTLSTWTVIVTSFGTVGFLISLGLWAVV